MRRIVTGERRGTQASKRTWWQAERLAGQLGLHLTGQLTVVRGASPASPDGRHSLFLGSRCQYCGSNDLDVSIYTVDPDACPQVWVCGAGHPENNLGSCDGSDVAGYAFCNLAPHAGDQHAYAYHEWCDRDGEPLPNDSQRTQTLRWVGRPAPHPAAEAWRDAVTAARAAAEVTPELLERVADLLTRVGNGDRDVAAFVAEHRKPQRSIVAAGVILAERDGRLVPALVDGPDIAEMLATMSAHAEAEAARPGAALEAAAAAYGLDPYEAHLALDCAGAGLSPVGFGALPRVLDRWARPAGECADDL